MLRHLIVSLLVFPCVAHASSARIQFSFDVPNVKIPEHFQSSGSASSQSSASTAYTFQQVSETEVRLVVPWKETHFLKFGPGNLPTTHTGNAEQTLLVTGSSGGGVKLWNLHTGTLLKNLVDPAASAVYPKAHKGQIVQLMFSNLRPDLLITEANDNTVKYWSASSGELLKTVPGEEHILQDNQGKLYSHKYGRLIQRNPETLQIERTLLAPDPFFLLSEDQKELHFELSTPEPSVVVTRLVDGHMTHHGPAIAWAVSPDGKQAAFYRGGVVVESLDLKHKTLRELKGPYAPFSLPEVTVFDHSILEYRQDSRALGFTQLSVGCCYGIMHDAPPFVQQQQTLVWSAAGRLLHHRFWTLDPSKEDDVSSTPIKGFSKLLATLPLTYPMLPGHKFVRAQTPLSEVYTPQGRFIELYSEEHDQQSNTVLDDIYLSHTGLKKPIKLVQLETSAEEATDFGVVFSPSADLIAFSPQEQKSGRTYLQYLFDAQTGKSPAGWPANLGGPIVAISPDTRQLLVEDAAKTWVVVDTRSLKHLCTVPKPEKQTLLLQFDPDHQGLWVGTGQQLLHFKLC